MNSLEFIKVIKKVVRESSIEDTISNIEEPPGRGASEAEKRRSEWFASLNNSQKEIIESIVSDAVDEAIFGLLCVIDGVRSIESGDKKGRLVLKYLGVTEELLNDPEKAYLHDLYNECVKN